MGLLTEKYNAWLKHPEKYTAKQVLVEIVADLKRLDEEEVENLTLGSVTTPVKISFAKRKVCSMGVDYEKCSEHPLNELGCSSCEKYIEQT